MSKEAELSDEQIDCCVGNLGMAENSILAGPDEIRRAMRAAIAADRELRQGAAGMPEPAAAELRFKGQQWRECTVEHAAMVLAAPLHEWKSYEVRYLYTAAQVQAMLAQGLAAQPLTQERKPMTQLEINSMVNSIAHYSGDYEDAIVCAVEKHHGIRPISDGEAIK